VVELTNQMEFFDRVRGKSVLLLDPWPWGFRFEVVESFQTVFPRSTLAI